MIRLVGRLIVWGRSSLSSALALATLTSLMTLIPMPAQAETCTADADKLCVSLNTNEQITVDISNPPTETGPDKPPIDGADQTCGVGAGTAPGVVTCVTNGVYTYTGVVNFTPHFAASAGDPKIFDSFTGNTSDGSGAPPPERYGLTANWGGWVDWIDRTTPKIDYGNGSTSESYPTIAANWQDKVYYTKTSVYTTVLIEDPSIICQIAQGWDPVCDPPTLVTTVVDTYVYNSRNIVWWPTWAPSPKNNVKKQCPTTVKNATVAGPLIQGTPPTTRANAVTMPFPVQLASTTTPWEQKTLKRKWYLVPYDGTYTASDLEWVGGDPYKSYMTSKVYRDWVANKANYPTNDSGLWDIPSIPIMLNCEKMEFSYSTEKAKTSVCVSDWDPYYGPPVTGSNLDCSFVNGNYNRRTDGYQLGCIITQRFWPEPHKVIRSCDSDEVLCSPLKPCSPNDTVWFCDAAKGTGWNDTELFTDCGHLKIQCIPGVDSGCLESLCIWPGGVKEPKIKGPDSVAIPNKSQMISNGKQWTITYPKPTLNAGSLIITDYWQQWVMVTGSQPFKEGATNNATNQPVFGHYTKTLSPLTGTLSIISTLYDTNGSRLQGWNEQTLYLRSYRGALANNTSDMTLGSQDDGYGESQVSNPLTVKKGDIMPYGLFESYNYDFQTSSNTKVGGSSIWKGGLWCRTNAAWMYMVSGRAASS